MTGGQQSMQEHHDLCSRHSHEACTQGKDYIKIVKKQLQIAGFECLHDFVVEEGHRETWYFARERFVLRIELIHPDTATDSYQSSWVPAKPLAICVPRS